MTMTKANQLARDKAAKQAGKPAAGGLPSLVNLPATSAVEVPSASRFAVTPFRHADRQHHAPVSAGTSADVNTNTTTSTLTPRPVAGTPVTTPVISGLPSGRICGHTDTVMPERAL